MEIFELHATSPKRKPARRRGSSKWKILKRIIEKRVFPFVYGLEKIKMVMAGFANGNYERNLPFLPDSHDWTEIRHEWYPLSTA